MEKDLVGYRFFPTGEELINYYLKNKILGKSWLVDSAISEINICNYEPMFLPSLSKLESKDPVWYFFSPREYTSAKKKVTKRTTGSGYWKATGVDRKIKDKRGNRGEVGIKKTLVYYEGRVPNGVWTPWVMHEYHITCLPLHQRTYVICQVMYKGEDGDILYGNNSSEPSHSLVEQPGQEDGLFMNDLLEDLSPCDGFNPDTIFNDSIPNVQRQTPCDDEFFSGLLKFNGGNFSDVLTEWEMQEHHNDHRPKKPLSGIIANYSSDTDSIAESISATSYQGTSSPGDSVGSSNRHFPRCSSTDSCQDVQTSADPPSISTKNRESQIIQRTIPSKQEVEEGKSKAVDATIDKESSSMVKTEKKGWFITEEAMKRKGKSPRYIYLMNTIIGFTLLVTLIGNIMSVLLSVKT